MVNFRSLAFGFLVTLVGCTSGPVITLDQIQPKRVYAMTKAKTLEALRFFSLKEGFTVTSAEEEAGRFIGHRVSSARDPNSGDAITMQVRLTALDSLHTEVLPVFRYSIPTTNLTREEEGVLVDCYLSLFRVLENSSE
jgi:hypothetical protein